MIDFILGLFTRKPRLDTSLRGGTQQWGFTLIAGNGRKVAYGWGHPSERDIHYTFEDIKLRLDTGERGEIYKAGDQWAWRLWDKDNKHVLASNWGLNSRWSARRSFNTFKRLARQL